MAEADKRITASSSAALAGNRLLGADFVRASACLIVLVHHLAQRVNWRGDMGPLEPVRFFVGTGGFGVAIFFVLSGFLLSRPFWRALDTGAPMPSLAVYALRRAARILPGFWLALTITFVLSILVFGFAPNAWLIGRYLSGLFLVSDWHWTTLFPVEVNGPLWSIGFEISSYAILPLGFLALFALPRNLPPWATRLAWLAVIGSAVLLHAAFTAYVPVDPIGRGWEYGLQGGAKIWMPRFNPFAFFAMFAIGALAGGAQVLLGRYRAWLFDALALAALIAAGWLLWVQATSADTEAWGWFGVPYDFPAFHLAIGAVLATAPSSILLGRLLDNPPVRYVAQVSFGVYVWHMLVIELVRQAWLPALDHGALNDAPSFATASLVVIAITFAIATFSFRFVEAPVIAWARKLEARPSTPTFSPAAG
jgi:peptidoglycan/LPS O-acetylase OafA/YrhL